MQEGRVYRLRSGMEAEEFTNHCGWLWVFLGYTHVRGRPSYARARSVATGDVASFFRHAFEEVEDGDNSSG